MQLSSELSEQKVFNTRATIKDHMLNVTVKSTL